LSEGVEPSVDWNVIPRNMGFLFGGLRLTFELAAISVAAGFLLGTILCMGRLSSKPWLFLPATLYVNLFRSLPLILVIFWFYFLVPILIGRPLGDYLSALIGFVAFEAAYFAEIVRGGIQSVPRGQMEAGYSTGLRYHQIMLYVILPQAVKNMVPPLVSQCVIIFQDTSLAYVIGLKEFLRRVSIVDLREFRSVDLYLFAAAVYLVFCSGGAILSRQLERRQRRHSHGADSHTKAKRLSLGLPSTVERFSP
jgi:glutamate/aspartate transport system permease protein